MTLQERLRARGDKVIARIDAALQDARETMLPRLERIEQQVDDLRLAVDTHNLAVANVAGGEYDRLADTVVDRVADHLNSTTKRLRVVENRLEDLAFQVSAVTANIVTPAPAELPPPPSPERPVEPATPPAEPAAAEPPVASPFEESTPAPAPVLSLEGVAATETLAPEEPAAAEALTEAPEAVPVVEPPPVAEAPPAEAPAFTESGFRIPGGIDRSPRAVNGDSTLIREVEAPPAPNSPGSPTIVRDELEMPAWLRRPREERPASNQARPEGVKRIIPPKQRLGGESEPPAGLARKPLGGGSTRRPSHPESTPSPPAKPVQPDQPEEPPIEEAPKGFLGGLFAGLKAGEGKKKK